MLRYHCGMHAMEGSVACQKEHFWILRTAVHMNMYIVFIYSWFISNDMNDIHFLFLSLCFIISLVLGRCNSSL